MAEPRITVYPTARGALETFIEQVEERGITMHRLNFPPTFLSALRVITDDVRQVLTRHRLHLDPPNAAKCVGCARGLDVPPSMPWVQKAAAWPCRVLDEYANMLNPGWRDEAKYEA